MKNNNKIYKYLYINFKKNELVEFFFPFDKGKKIKIIILNNKIFIN